MANKIRVAEYLRNLNNQVKVVNRSRFRPINVDFLDCKEIAKRLEVSPSTISNLNVDSKYSLIRSIAVEISDAYEDFLSYKTEAYYKELLSRDENISREFINFGSVDAIVSDLYYTSLWDL